MQLIKNRIKWMTIQSRACAETARDGFAKPATRQGHLKTLGFQIEPNIY